MTVAFPAPNTNITHTEVFNVNIIVCDNSAILSGVIPSAQEYLIGQTKHDFVFGVYSQAPLCGYAFTYDLVEDGQATLPAGVTFNPTTRMITLESTNNAHAGTFILRITASLDDVPVSSDNSQTITVTLHDPNTYCQADQVVFTAPNAGLDLNYLYYFERTPQALVLIP